MPSHISLDSLLSVPGLSSPIVSPDGEWVVWSFSRVGPATDVFVARTDGSVSPIRLTETPDDTYPVSWTPGGEALIVEEDDGGDERVRLFLVRLDAPGRMEPLTESNPEYFLRGGQLHPNGRWLVYGANYDFEAGEEIEAFRVIRHDLETGERKVLAKPERGNFRAPEMNAPGDLAIHHRSDLDPSGLQVWLVDIEGSFEREILNFGPKAKVRASWFPDGRRIVFVAEAVAETVGSHRRLGVWEDGEIKWLVADPGRNVEYAFVPPNGEPEGDPVVAVEVERARERAALLDPDSGEEAHPPEVEGGFTPLSRAGGGWLGLRYGSRNPSDIVFVSDDGRESSVTGLWEHTDLDSERLARAEDFVWNSDDGLEIQGWLYRAEESIGSIVLVHGGPTAHSEDRFVADAQYFVSRGFDVLRPNYRGSTGFGLEFQEKIKEDGWGGSEQTDIKSGVEAMIEAGIARPGKVGITGTSYGGYSAWHAITNYPTELFSASAPICGMTDLIADYETTRPDLRPYSEEMMGGTPETVPEKYRERSPIHFVENVRGRLLIIQGMRDPNVTPENVRLARERLDHFSVPYEILAFEGEGHGIVRPENQRTLYKRLADFFEGAFHAPHNARGTS